MKATLLLTLLSLTPLANTLCAQDIMTGLTSWRMQEGDDSRWADPGFDDSSWTTVGKLPHDSRSAFSPALTSQTTWYRTNLRIPEGWVDRELELSLNLVDAYEVFVNGVPVGTFGRMPPVGSTAGDSAVTAFTGRYSTFRIPRALARDGRLQISVRNWRLRVTNSFQVHYLAGGRPDVDWSLIGLSPVLSQNAELATFRSAVLSAPTTILWLITLLCGLICLALPRYGNRHLELLWLGLALIATGGLSSVSIPLNLGGLPKTSMVTFAWTFAGFFGSVFFFGWFLAELLPQWRRALRWASVPIALGTSLWVVHVYFPFQAPHAFIRTASFAGQMAVGLAAAWVVLRNRQTSLVPPILAIVVRDGVYMTGTFLPSAMLPVGNSVVSVRTAADAVIGVLLVWYLAARMRREHALQLEMSQDLEAARRVQEMLLESGDLNGGHYRIDPVCRAAREVGGDFYQIVGQPDGATLLVAGDVSGKGLKAAMLVSVIVGALRAQKAASPAAILAGLNEALFGHMGGGFVTCCCVRLEPGGGVVLANAGHLPPWLDGREMEIEAGLPLGIVGQAEYAESRVEMGRGSQLTIVSDGVVEAENAGRELFGFERTREISGKPAADIAEAAKAWGQNDDITVVTVRRNS